MRHILVEKLSVHYLSQRTKQLVIALHELQFSVTKGEFVAIIGPSGCGKTSLLNVIAGLQAGTSGQVWVEDRPAFAPGPDRVMEVGVVVGTVMSVPETTAAKKLGYKVLVDMSSLGIPYQHTTIATSTHYIEENHEAVVRFLKAAIEAIAKMKNDREGSIAVIAQYMLLDVEAGAASLDEAYDVLIQGYLPDFPEPTLAGVQTGLDVLALENRQIATLKAAVVDSSILEEIRASGFLEDLQND